jgi:hypothetical protein
MIAYEYNWADFVGNIGVALLISSYALLQFDRINPRGLWYSLINLFVAILLMISLYHKPNLSGIIIEAFWFVLSIYGLIKYFKSRQSNTQA